MIPACRHIKTNGVRCRANALCDRPYCYYHDRLHRTLNNQKPTPKNSLMLHPLEDRESVFLALSDVVCALAAGRIDTHNATRLIHGLQVAGKYAPESSSSVAKDAVESVDFTKTGDELAPELAYCTDDDECDSCECLDTCQLQQAKDWRAANPAEDENENAGDEEEEDESDSDEDESNDEDDEEENESPNVDDANAA